MKINKTLIFVLFLGSLSLFSQVDLEQKTVLNRENSSEQTKKPYVILISADGFRADLATKYNAEHLIKFRNKGVEAKYMHSSYPSLTFPNHYSIITGLYPSHSGLVDNSFYDENKKELYSMGNKKQVADSSWYGGKPIWVLAEEQKMLSASYFWVASEAAIKGVRPSYYYIYNEKAKIEDRVAAVKTWLELPEEKRPHFITFYFPEVDHAEHVYGVDSKETEEAVRYVDNSINMLVNSLNTLNIPINYIFVSDHGMTQTDPQKAILLPEIVDKEKFIVPNGNALLHLYAKDKKDVLPTYNALKKEAKDYDVYLTQKMPKKWHYSKRDDYYNRIGDIVLVPHLPGYFISKPGAKTNIGKHGFDPKFKDMHATFYAWGPAFKNNKKIGGFENVNVYPLIANILGLKYDEKEIDGNFKVLKNVLTK